jgi:hypothetical protein
MAVLRSKSGLGGILRGLLLFSAAGIILISGALAQSPLAAKIYVSPLASYSGVTPLPKPAKILIYDFAVSPDEVQVDKVQALRPGLPRYQRIRIKTEP